MRSSQIAGRRRRRRPCRAREERRVWRRGRWLERRAGWRRWARRGGEVGNPVPGPAGVEGREQQPVSPRPGQGAGPASCSSGHCLPHQRRVHLYRRHHLGAPSGGVPACPGAPDAGPLAATAPAHADPECRSSACSAEAGEKRRRMCSAW